MAEPRSRSAIVLGVGLAASVLGVVPSFLIGTLAVAIRRDIPLSPSQLGLLISGSLLCSALMSPALGSLTERRGATAGLRIAMTASAVATAGIGLFAANLIGLVIGMLIAGIGQAAVHPAANLILARRISPRRQGLAFGVKQASIPMAALAGGLAVPVANTVIGWRGVFVLAAVAATVVWLVAPVASASSMPSGERRRALPVRIGPLVVLAVGAALSVGAIQPVAQFYVPFSVEAGLSAATAGTFLAIASVASIGLRLASGALATGRPPSRLFRASAAAIAVATTGPLLLAFGSKSPTLAAGVIIALGIGFGWNPILHYAVVRAHLDAPAAASSITQTGLLIGAGLGPLAFGLLADWHSYRSAWLALAFALPVGALMFVIAARMVRSPVRTDLGRQT